MNVWNSLISRENKCFNNGHLKSLEIIYEFLGGLLYLPDIFNKYIFVMLLSYSYDPSKLPVSILFQLKKKKENKP